jgi:hypothetical protein
MVGFVLQPVHTGRPRDVSHRHARSARGRCREPIRDWSLTSLKEKLIKIGAKVVRHGRCIAFQMAEVAIPRRIFQEILRLIAELRPLLPPAPA